MLSSFAHATVLIMPERNDLEVQLDFYYDELLRKIPAGNISLYIADLASSEKGKRYTVLNENVKGYFRHLASMNSSIKVIQDRDLDAKMTILIHQSRGKALASYQIADAVRNRNDVDIVLYGYLSSMQDKLVLQMEAFDRRKGATVHSKYIASREESIVAQLGIGDYGVEEFTRHAIGASLRFSTEKTNLDEKDSVLAMVNIHYCYYILKNTAIGLQLGYPVYYSVSQELGKDRHTLSTTESTLITIYEKSFTGFSYDIELNINQHMLQSRVFKPLFSTGVGLSNREYEYEIFEYYSNSSPITSEFNRFPFKGSAKYYYAIASIGADLFFNPNFFLRILANYQYTFNRQEIAYPMKHDIFRYELYAPPLTFTAGLFVKF